MVNTLTQWRAAVGSHCNFIKFKECKNLHYILDKLQSLIDYFGPVIVAMLMNFPYCYAMLAICLVHVKVKNSKSQPMSSRANEIL